MKLHSFYLCGMLIDTHTHLYSAQFDEDRDQMIARAISQGVTKFLLPNIDLESVSGMYELVDRYPGVCYPMMGLHPCSVAENWEEQLHAIRVAFEGKPYIAIGEIGIDLYWDKSTLPFQIGAFRAQVKWAKELNLPIVIHARDSFQELFEQLDELNDSSLTGVFHCFTGGMPEAEKILSYGGFKLGIGGVVTFKKSGLDEVLNNVPLEHIILETDSPYLAPTPYRGKRNESAYVRLVAEKLAEVYACEVDEIARHTSANATTLFTKING
jgi:TatD DNase family protein